MYKLNLRNTIQEVANCVYKGDYHFSNQDTQHNNLNVIIQHHERRIRVNRIQTVYGKEVVRVYHYENGKYSDGEEVQIVYFNDLEKQNFKLQLRFILMGILLKENKQTGMKVSNPITLGQSRRTGRTIYRRIADSFRLFIRR